MITNFDDYNFQDCNNTYYHQLFKKNLDPEISHCYRNISLGYLTLEVQFNVKQICSYAGFVPEKIRFLTRR